MSPKRVIKKIKFSPNVRMAIGLLIILKLITVG